MTKYPPPTELMLSRMVKELENHREDPEYHERLSLSFKRVSQPITAEERVNIFMEGIE